MERRGKNLLALNKKWAEELTKEEKKQEDTRRRKKVKSVRALAQDIGKLRNHTTRDMKSDDEKIRLVALAISMIDKTAERVGNESSAKDGHVGITGLKKKHISMEGDTVHLSYIAKSGVKQEKQFTDKTMAKLVRSCLDRCKGDNDFLLTTEDGLKIKAPQVNRYLEDFGVTAKDIRGYAANDLVLSGLRNADLASDEKERQKKFRDVIKSVAAKVGHGQQTLRKHYLLPTLESEYVKKGKIVNLKSAGLYNSEDVSRIAGKIVKKRLGKL